MGFLSNILLKFANVMEYSDIIRQIKSRRMSWVGNVVHMGETCTEFWWESLNEKDQGVDGRMGSKWTLGCLAGRVWSGFTLLRIGTVGRLS
jgi:hypothetical protein